MAQINTGLRKILSLPIAYSLLQKSLGGKRASKFFAENYVNAASKSKILDIGCGPSEILVHLPKDAGYVGYDLSEKYIDAARTRFGNRGTWHCAPVSEMCVNEVGTFDIVIASGILHHLGNSEAMRLVEVAFSSLKPRGRLVCLENAFTDDQSYISRLIVSADRGQNVRTPDGYAELLYQHFSSVSTHVYHDLLRIPYTHVILVGTKDSLNIN
jgi:cyclopropane fatty-acyl-phospholipid synthase-like methyltransferase